MEDKYITYAKNLYRKHFGFKTQSMTNKCWLQASEDYRQAWVTIAKAEY